MNGNSREGEIRRNQTRGRLMVDNCENDEARRLMENETSKTRPLLGCARQTPLPISTQLSFLFLINISKSYNNDYSTEDQSAFL